MTGLRYHTIFLDVGGTLLKAKPSMGAVYAEVAARYGIEVDADRIERNARRHFLQARTEEDWEHSPHTASLEKARAWWSELIRSSFGPAAGSPRFDAFCRAVFDEFGHPSRYEFFPEVEGVLQGLESAGYRLGLISNWDLRLRPVLEGLGMVERFDPIVISAEVGHAKPDPRIFHEARRQAGATGGEPLLQVGDNQREDVEGAIAAGFDARFVDRGGDETLDSVLGDLMA